MDNPWADAHQEADLATPSWSTGAAVRWAEPANLSSLWNNAAAADLTPPWTPPKSPYDDIPLGRPALQRASLPDDPVSERHDSTNLQTVPITPDSPTADSPPQDSPPPEFSAEETPPQILTRPDSPDGFGTFETADTWTSPEPALAPSSLDDDNAWGAAWAPTSDPESSPEDQHQVDEWELAKLQKQKQDQHVPPELLDSVLEQLKELSSDLWPESGLDDGEARELSKDFILDVPSLKPAVDKFIPDDLVLSANVQFMRTFTSKHMNEALRLTRNLPMTQSSPMAVYMASKGSTAWEMSVKSRQDVHQEDALPPGWRMVEKSKQEPVPAPEVRKKAGGGLLTFLGLKNNNASVEPSQKSSPSPSRPGSMIGSSKSQRSSLDGSSKPASERRSSMSQHSIQSTAVTTPSSGSLAPIASSDSEQKSARETTSQTAPSAVSRFFGRFSRSSAAANSTCQSRSQSLALSSDDIEFLSDIVPSASDDVDDDENLRSLTNMISAKSPSSLSASPLPQLLPPPPKPLQLPATSIFASSPMPKADDPFSLLDSFTAVQPLTTAESKSTQPLVPIILSAPNSSILPPPRQIPKPTSTPPIKSSSGLTRTQLLLPTLVPLPPPSQQRGFTAVMTSSGRSTPSNLPPPPLPPPPASPLSAMPPLQPPTLVQGQQPQGQQASPFDDDEFSDFLSSPAVAELLQQPSISQAMSRNMSAATTRSIGASHVNTSSSISSLSSIVSDESLLPSRSTSFRANVFTTPSKWNKKSGLGLLEDDFDELMSLPMTSTLPSPPPPRPPSKPKPGDFNSVPLRPNQPPSPLVSLMQSKDRDPFPPPPPPPQRPSRAVDHSRIPGLLESAAGRLLPLSPQPKTIVPPPPQSEMPSDTNARLLNIFDDMEGETIRQPSRGQIGGGEMSSTLWDLPPPPPGPTSLGSLMPLRAMSPPLASNKANGTRTGNSAAPSNVSFWSLGANDSGSRPLPPTAATQSNKVVDGLSTQDLSFFEGL